MGSPDFNRAIQQIKEVGYAKLEGLYDKALTKGFLDHVKADYENYNGSTTKDVPFLNIDQPTVYNLQNKRVDYLNLVLGNELLEKILMHFLNDVWFKQIPQEQPNYILRSLIARSSNKPMPLHIDSFVPYTGDHVFMMQFSVILEDQSRNNGCTIVVPKSHACGQYATQDYWKGAVPIESKAGDVVIWDSRLWHGTTANDSPGTRWAIIATFCRWWIKQHWNVPRALPHEIFDAVSEKDRAILGYCSASHLDEQHGIDMKRGYADISYQDA